MKKIALLLTLVMVLGLGASAMAADIKTSGKVFVSYEKLDSATDPTWSNGYRVQLDGKLDDNSGFQIRFEGSGLLKRANYWANFPGLGKVTAGMQQVNYGVTDQLVSDPSDVVDGTDFFSNTFNGISFAPALPEGFKAAGFVALANAIGTEGQPGYVSAEDQYIWGAEVGYDFGVANVVGAVSKKTMDDDAKFVFGASAPIIKDTLSVYGEYATKGDGDANDEKVIGAHATAGGFELYGEYALDAEIYMVEAYKTINNVELNAVYFGGLGDDGDDSKVVLNTTLYF